MKEDYYRIYKIKKTLYYCKKINNRRIEISTKIGHIGTYNSYLDFENTIRNFNDNLIIERLK